MGWTCEKGHNNLSNGWACKHCFGELNERLGQAYADFRRVNERGIELKAENARLRAALERIADPVPSMGRPSFADWELRQIAREALGKVRG